MCIAVLSTAAFIHWKPFVKSENDTLAIVSQMSIFFTLFAGLLKRMDVDKLDDYDQAVFGWLLILVNCIGVVMVVVGFLVKPIARFVKNIARKHLHNAPLKGIGDEHADWNAFDAYVRELVASDEFSAGWEIMTTKDWGGSGKNKKGVDAWLEETGAKGEWRCGNGNGPADQCRVCVIVQQKLEDVIEFLTTFSTPTGTTLENALEHTNYDGTHDIYHAVRMPWPFAERDFKLRRSVQTEEDVARIFFRSVEDSDHGLKKTALLGRVRASLSLGGYYLQRDGESTRVTYVLEVHLGGVMQLDAISRRAAGPQLKSVVDGLRHLGEGEDDGQDVEEGRGSSLWRAAPRWLRAVSSGTELGGGQKGEARKKQRDIRKGAPPPPPMTPAPTYDNNIFTNGQFEMSILSNNPMHEKKKKKKKKEKETKREEKSEEEKEEVEWEEEDEKDGGKKKESEKKDIRHLQRAVSGGFGKPVGDKTKLKGKMEERGVR
jgi:hypothetical protein